MEAHHLSPEKLDRFARGNLGDDDLSAVLAHLETCPSCAQAGREYVRRDVLALQAELSVEPHPSRTPRAWIIGLAAAAALLLVIMSVLMRSPAPDSPPHAPPVVATTPALPAPPAGYGRAEWDAIVRAVRAGEPMKMPLVLRSLRRPEDILRGPEDPRGSGQLSPSGVVVETTRPAFIWNAEKGDRSTVFVLAGDREVARSKPLTTGTWRAPFDLPRGVTYTWQVEIDRNGELDVIPSLPAQPPQFHILDAATLAEIEAARRHHAADPFFLGIIYARAGMVEEARAELRRVREGDDAPAAQRLLQEIDSWPVPRTTR